MASEDGSATHLRAFSPCQGLVNIVGGCCGTSPAHIEATAHAVASLRPRPLPHLDMAPPPILRLSGLDAFEVPLVGCPCGCRGKVGHSPVVSKRDRARTQHDQSQ